MADTQTMNAHEVADALQRGYPPEAIRALLRSLGERSEFRKLGHATHLHWTNDTLGGALFASRCIILVRRTPKSNVYRVTPLGRRVARVIGARWMKLNMEGQSQFSFCETVAATGPWHIRLLTDAGKKLSGGADTPTLCGLEAAWDLSCEITEASLRELSSHRYGYPCSACKSKYLALIQEVVD